MRHSIQARVSMLTGLRNAVAGFGFTCLAATAQAPEDVRLALVIGNSAYRGPAALINPGNDAAAMTGTLATLGFSVIELRDGTRAQMNDAIGKVREKLKGKHAIGMLYYAGHAMQIDFHNYMVPIDAKLTTRADVIAQTVDLATVMDAFKTAGNRLNIMVLDACRDNPFGGNASAKGLAPLDAPTGTFLAYATAPGNVAEDGDMLAGNGLYTGYLVKELQKPSVRIEDVFKRVRLQVRQRSEGRQIPWESTSLEDDFYFNDGVRYTFRPEDFQRLAAEANRKEQLLLRQAEREREGERQQAALKAAEELRMAEAERQREMEMAAAQAREHERLKRLSREQAREEEFRIEKAEWDRIKDSKSAADFYAFLDKYPNGNISELAQVKLEQLTKAQIQTQPDRDGKAQGSVLARIRDGDRYELLFTDGLTKQTKKGTARTAVSGVDEFTMSVTGSWGQVVNSAGFVIRDGDVQPDPPWPTAPGGEFQVGKSWKGRSIVTKVSPGPRDFPQWVDIEAKVSAKEKITTPFGIIDTYKVELKFLHQNGSRTNLTYWFDPEWGYPMKTERVSRRYSMVAPDIFISEVTARSRLSYDDLDWISGQGANNPAGKERN